MPGKPVVAPFNPYGLTPLDRNKKLENVNVIKEELCVKIKGRTCTNVGKQRKYLKPDEIVYSPTCSNEALMATLVIYVMEQSDVSIFDFSGAFIKQHYQKTIFY